MRQQISFDESDDFIMASSVCPSTSSNKEMEVENAENASFAKPQQISPTIGPEDLQLVERLSDGQFGTVYKWIHKSLLYHYHFKSIRCEK